MVGPWQASRLARGNVLRLVTECDVFSAGDYPSAPTLLSAAVHDPASGRVSVFALNRSREPMALSVDLPFAQKRFCAAEGIDRVHVFSDYKELDFGIKYGFVIDELRLLARGVVVVDKDDVVRYVEYVPEITNEPDYEKALAFVRELAK